MVNNGEEASCLSTDANREERDAFVTPAHPQEVRCQELQEEGAQEVSGGVCFPDAQEGGVSGNGGKGEPGGHEGGGGVLQKGSFGWRLINFYAEELSV